MTRPQDGNGINGAQWDMGAYEYAGESLIAYYPFNGNANDESGNGHDANVIGASATEDRYGEPGSAYSFAGITEGDYILYQDNDSDFKFSNDFSVLFWLNSDLGNQNGQYISSSFDSGTGYKSGWQEP